MFSRIMNLPIHSMATANLNKSEELATNTTTASIEIPPFRLYFIKFSKTVFYEVNLTSQCSHLEVLLISKFVDMIRGISNDVDSGPLRYVL